MLDSRSFGIFLIAVGSVLFTVLVYEPANIVAALGVGDVMDEASVALVCLGAVAGSLLGGIITLRRHPRLPELRRGRKQAVQRLRVGNWAPTRFRQACSSAFSSWATFG